MSYVWDYRTGDVVDSETGEVVDRIYMDDDGKYPNPDLIARRWHYDVVYPSVSMHPCEKSRFRKAKAAVMRILGRSLTGKERIRLARWLVAARRLTRKKRDNMWLYTTVYMFLTDLNVDPTPHVPTRAALVASSVTRPNRYAAVVKRIVECLARLGRPHLMEVAAEVARELFRRYPSLTGGKPASTVAAAAVYIASVMTEEDPLTKKAVCRALEISKFNQSRALVVNTSPFTVLADRELCDAVSRRARLHQRVICVDRSRRNGPEGGTGPGDGGSNQPGAGR